MTKAVFDREVFEEWYFPAIFPTTLLLLKYLVLLIAGVFSTKNIVPDICYIPIIFDVWAPSSYKENLNKVERIKREGKRKMAPLNIISIRMVLLFLSIHSILYLFSIFAWMTEPQLKVLWQFLSLFSIFFSGWIVVYLLRMEELVNGNER
jgi:hypothetical protein